MMASTLIRRRLLASVRTTPVVASASVTSTRALGTSKKKKKGVKAKLKVSPAVVDQPEKDVINPKVKAWNEEQIAKLQKKKQSDEPEAAVAAAKDQPSSEDDRPSASSSVDSDSKLKSVSAVLKEASRTTEHQQEPKVLTGDDYASIPHGSVVYHGTSLSHLRAALREGHFQPASKKKSKEDIFLPPASVSLSSFFKALSFSMKPAVEASEGRGHHDNADDVIPMVVELELKDDAEIIMDNDFFLGANQLSTLMGPVPKEARQELYNELHHDAQLASISWNKFLSAGMCNPLSTSCIRTIYTPRIQSEGVPHPHALHLIVAAMLLEMQKQPSLGGWFWEDATLLPVVQLSKQDVLSGDPISAFDATKFMNAAQFRIQQHFQANARFAAKVQQAKGNLDVLDAINLQECQRRAGVEEIIEERMASIRDKYLE